MSFHAGCIYPLPVVLFPVCFYKNLLRYGRVCTAFFHAQRIMRTITKREILSDWDYISIDMADCLQQVQDDEMPFAQSGEWAVFLLQMNEGGNS